MVRRDYLLLAGALIAAGIAVMWLWESVWGLVMALIGGIVLLAGMGGGKGESFFSWADKENALIDFWRVHGKGGN